MDFAFHYVVLAYRLLYKHSAPNETYKHRSSAAARGRRRRGWSSWRPLDPMSMAMDSEDIVKIENGKSPTELSVITVNCQDKLGLACDLCRIILDFGLLITKGGLWIWGFCLDFLGF